MVWYTHHRELVESIEAPLFYHFFLIKTKHALCVLCFYIVPSRRIELLFVAPQATVLSIERRGDSDNRNLNYNFYALAKFKAKSSIERSHTRVW